MITKKKVTKKPWPQLLTKAQLLEEFWDLEAQVGEMEYTLSELRRELERRNIDPWK